MTERRTSPSMTFLASVVSVVVVAIVAGIGSQFMPGEWYAALEKPPFNPPNWIFGPVWTALYLAMAVAAVLVWRHWPARAAKIGLALYGATLVLNALWSPLFFGMNSFPLSFVDISTLLVLIYATIFYFWRVSKLAALIMVPYAAWVSFATLLNGSLWYLNPGA